MIIHAAVRTVLNPSLLFRSRFSWLIRTFGIALPDLCAVFALRISASRIRTCSLWPQSLYLSRVVARTLDVPDVDGWVCIKNVRFTTCNSSSRQYAAIGHDHPTPLGHGP